HWYANRQNCRDDDVPGVSTTVRLRLYIGDADQPLWPRDNFDLFSSHVRLPKSTLQSDATRVNFRFGVRGSHGENSCTSTISPMRSSSLCSIARRKSTSISE